MDLLVFWMDINFDNRGEDFSVVLNIFVPIADADKKFMRFMVMHTMRGSDHMSVCYQCSTTKSVEIPSITMFDTENKYIYLNFAFVVCIFCAKIRTKMFTSFEKRTKILNSKYQRNSLESSNYFNSKT